MTIGSMHTRWAALSAAALLLSACGGGDGNDSDASAAGNAPPKISGKPTTSTTQGATYSFAPAAEDGDGDALTFGIAGRPSWTLFDEATGSLTGVPGPSDVGTYRGIVISVSDGHSKSSLPAFDLAVKPVTSSNNRAPEIAGTPEAVVKAGSDYRFRPDTSDPDGDSLTFLIWNQPAWSLFNAATGELGGIPSEADTQTYESIVIGVSDGRSTTTLPPFDISVVSAYTNTPPSISGTPTPTVASGGTYVFVPTAADADGDALTFSITNRPSWATFDAVTGRLAGTPGGADLGSFGGIVISVSDGQASASLATFSIMVNAAASNTPPTISGVAPASVVSGDAYVFEPVAADADGDALTFSIANRPAWASFDASAGALTGTPARADAGTYGNILISVSDGHTAAELAPFSIRVDAANSPPTISGSPPTEVLTDTPYSFTPTAADPDGDALSFSIANAPAWASFDALTGTLEGTPGIGDVGTFADIRISVSDGQQSAALPAFSIDVRAVANGTATLSWTAPTQNTDGSPLLDLAGYHVYWGTSSGAYTSSATIDNPSVTTYIVDNLLSGTTYYFATSAYNSTGVQSNYSNEASKTIP
jgi:hypothetical protein